MKLNSVQSVLRLMIFSSLIFSGCYAFEHFKDKMHLTQAQAEKARPIIEKYLKTQDELLEALKSAQPPQNQGSAQSPPPGGRPSAPLQNRSEVSESREPENREAEKKFSDNDAIAASELEAFLSPDQVEEFKKAAVDYRKIRLKEQMQEHRGGPGGGRPPGGGGPGNSPGGNFGNF